MTDDSKKGPPAGGGIRPPEYLRQMALGRCEDLMAQGYRPREIAAKMIDDGYTDSLDTIRDWCQAVQKRWAAEDAQERPHRKDTWRVRIETQYRKLLEWAETTKSEIARASYMAEATKLTKLALIMDGLTAPVKVEHSGAMVDPMALQPHEREAKIAELMEKRKQAQEAAARTSGKVYS